MLTIIMAGGRGSRISELFPNIPKPLIPIKNVPVLEREIRSLASQGFKDIILTVSYLSEKIISYFGDGCNLTDMNGKKLGVKIEYFIEDVPLGNAGALFKMRERIGNEDFLLLNADAVFDVDFNRMLAFHKERHALVTLFTHPNSHPYDSGVIVADERGEVINWFAKEDSRPKYYKNRVNAGLHIISPIVLDQMDIDIKSIGKKNSKTGKTTTVDLDRQVLKPLVKSKIYIGKREKESLVNSGVFCYDSPEYVKDMGTPERYYHVVEDYITNVVESKNLKNKQKAIFLDRDGTINRYVGFLKSIDEFELLPGVEEAIKLINRSGFLVVVCTNQPVIARGEVTFSELEEIHNKMETLLGLEGAYIDRIYFCPHHPHKGYEGEVTALKCDCECRKPKPGLLLKAAKELNIELERSWMIGDEERDIVAGKTAGCKTALVDYSNSTGDKEKTEKKFGEDIIASTLLEAVKKILQGVSQNELLPVK